MNDTCLVHNIRCVNGAVCGYCLFEQYLIRRNGILLNNERIGNLVSEGASLVPNNSPNVNISEEIYVCEDDYLISENLNKFSKIDKCVDEGNMCSICLNNVKFDEVVRILECKHVYHIKCIDKWFEKNTKCPNCRHNLKKEVLV